MSFFKWSGISGNKEFVALKNYKLLLNDSVIPKTIINDYFLVIVKVVFIMMLALIFAVVLTQFKLKEAPFYRFVYFSKCHASCDDSNSVGVHLQFTDGTG